MNKRLRKKKHLGEYRQFGFSVDCRFRAGLSAAEFDRFIDEFIVQAIEANSLLFGGGGSPENGWSGVVSRDHRYNSTSEIDKSAVSGWLKDRSEVVRIHVSDTWDLWHGHDPFDQQPVEPVDRPHEDPRPTLEDENR